MHPLMLLMALAQHPQFGPLLQQLFSGGSQGLYGPQKADAGYGLAGTAAVQPGFGLSGPAAVLPDMGVTWGGNPPQADSGGGIHTMPIGRTFADGPKGRGRGIPGVQGFRGDSSAWRNPNQGGGVGLSEITNPGMSYASTLYGNGSLGGLSAGTPYKGVNVDTYGFPGNTGMAFQGTNIGGRMW